MKLIIFKYFNYTYNRYNVIKKNLLAFFCYIISYSKEYLMSNKNRIYKLINKNLIIILYNFYISNV